MQTRTNLLEIKNLSVLFYTYKSVVQAIKGLNLRIQKGETLGLVGESGCGKSVTAMSILRLIPIPPGKISSGEIWFEGQDLLTKSSEEMRRIRGKVISMIFQDPMTSLNPVFTVGDQITTVIRIHQKIGRTRAIKNAVELFTMVGLSDAATLLKKYPHELSGGMSQRVMIAMALSCRPSLLIADEPTTALDVTIQAQILTLMKKLKEDVNTSILLITHDLGVVAQMCQKVAVMYAGQIAEYGQLQHVFKNPKHPYTQGLLAATPKIGAKKNRLATISGNVPDLSDPPPGCLFHPRCRFKKDACNLDVDKDVEVEPGHFVSCNLYEEKS
jgi:oligopeptide/dipeptide ABC transporter ATP-binding protein